MTRRVAAEPTPAGPPATSRARALWVVITGLTVSGVVVGGVWAWIAPPVHGVVALTHSGARVHDYLGSEGDHFFVAAFLLLGLLSVLAVVASVLVWQWRAHRGPGMVVALSIGMAGAGAASAALGSVLVRHRYGVPRLADAPLTVANPVSYFVQAPPAFFGHTPWQIAATLLLPVSLAALVYALLVSAAARDDLGAYPAVDAQHAPIEVAVSGEGSTDSRGSAQPSTPQGG